MPGLLRRVDAHRVAGHEQGAARQDRDDDDRDREVRDPPAHRRRWRHVRVERHGQRVGGRDGRRHGRLLVDFGGWSSPAGVAGSFGSIGSGRPGSGLVSGSGGWRSVQRVLETAHVIACGSGCLGDETPERPAIDIARWSAPDVARRVSGSGRCGPTPTTRGCRGRRRRPTTSTTRSRVSDPNWSGRTRKKSTMKPLMGSAAAARTPQRDERAEQADEGSLEDERPADEGVRRTDQPHDLDLLGPRQDGEPDRVDDDEQRDHPDHEQDDGAGRPQDVGHGQRPARRGPRC